MTAVTQVLRLTLPDDAKPAAAAAGVKRRIAAAAGRPTLIGWPRIWLQRARVCARSSRERWVRRLGDKVAASG